MRGFFLDAGYLILDAGCLILCAPSACRHSFSGGTSFSVSVLATVYCILYIVYCIKPQTPYLYFLPLPINDKKGEIPILHRLLQGKYA